MHSELDFRPDQIITGHVIYNSTYKYWPDENGQKSTIKLIGKNTRGKFLTHSWNNLLHQNVENCIESIVRLTIEYSRYNLFHFYRVEEIQVM